MVCSGHPHGLTPEFDAFAASGCVNLNPAEITTERPENDLFMMRWVSNDLSDIKQMPTPFL
jgi:hypothetical protein